MHWFLFCRQKKNSMLGQSLESHCIPCCLLGVIAGARLRNLRTGHSHEDVDQLFGVLAAYIARHGRSANCPKEFCHHIQMWLTTKLDRPHEPLRKCVLMEQCRDWILGFPSNEKEASTSRQIPCLVSMRAPQCLCFSMVRRQLYDSSQIEVRITMGLQRNMLVNQVCEPIILESYGPYTDSVVDLIQSSLAIIQLLRRGFLAGGVPVFLKGTGGPRAPHVFEFDRRGNLGSLAGGPFPFYSFRQFRQPVHFFVLLWWLSLILMFFCGAASGSDVT